MSRLFVTATGTDVGKTYLCCRLIESLAGGPVVRVIKPVASGVEPAALDRTDTAALLRAQGIAVDAATFEQTTPWHFVAPLSPDMAAAREGRRVPVAAVVDFCRRDDGAELTIIEGVGGALVPLDERHTVLDLIAAVDAAVWLVSGSYLGAISHTLATLAAIEGRGINVSAIVVSESAEPAAPLQEIIDVIARFAGSAQVAGLGRPPSAAQIAALGRLLPA
jgi:dethiobiotin synthetase